MTQCQTAQLYDLESFEFGQKISVYKVGGMDSVVPENITKKPRTLNQVNSKADLRASKQSARSYSLFNKI